METYINVAFLTGDFRPAGIIGLCFYHQGIQRVEPVLSPERANEMGAQRRLSLLQNPISIVAFQGQKRSS